MKRTLPIFLALVGLLSLTTDSAFAHVILKPSQVPAATSQTFTLSVPNEKDSDTVSLRLLIPDGLSEVVPSVKPGWKVKTVQTADKVTEIDWTEGSIPVGLRDDFSFSAQAPSKTGLITWKVYQTYKDGSVVSWDQDPASIKAGEEGTPYSTTQVINDLATPTPSSTKDLSLWLGSLSIILSLVAIGLNLHKR